MEILTQSIYVTSPIHLNDSVKVSIQLQDALYQEEIRSTIREACWFRIQEQIGPDQWIGTCATQMLCRIQVGWEWIMPIRMGQACVIDRHQVVEVATPDDRDQMTEYIRTVIQRLSVENRAIFDRLDQEDQIRMIENLLRDRQQRRHV